MFLQRHCKMSARSQDHKRQAGRQPANLGPLLCPVGAGKHSVPPTVPSVAESGKDDDLIWYLLTINQQNTNGLGRCQERGEVQRPLCCLNVPCSPGECSVQATPEERISQGPRTEAAPIRWPAAPGPSLSLGSHCYWKPQGQGRRVLTRALIPIPLAGASQAPC